MAQPEGVVTTTLLACSPAPCPALDAILADDEHIRRAQLAEAEAALRRGR